MHGQKYKPFSFSIAIKTVRYCFCLFCLLICSICSNSEDPALSKSHSLVFAGENSQNFFHRERSTKSKDQQIRKFLHLSVIFCMCVFIFILMVTFMYKYTFKISCKLLVLYTYIYVPSLFLCISPFLIFILNIATSVHNVLESFKNICKMHIF